MPQRPLLVEQICWSAVETKFPGIYLAYAPDCGVDRPAHARRAQLTFGKSLEVGTRRSRIEPRGAVIATYKVGYFVGSLSSKSINRILSKALIRLAPDDLEFSEIPIGNLPLYSQDYDDNYPPGPTALKEAIGRADAVLFVTPEYNRSIPGALKNAIDWASRPWGQNAFDHIPAAVVGASIGQIGTAVAQQSLRGVLSFCNARQMTAPEAYIQYSPDIFTEDGEVTSEATAAFLRSFMTEFRDHVARVLTVLPRQAAS